MKKPSPHDDTPERLHTMQMAFAGHLRNPEAVPAPTDVEDRRMEVYRGLFFRNIRSFIAGSYPVLRSLYDDDDWDQLIRDFYNEHRCQTPMFPELSREFLRYLQESRQQHEDEYSFMLELAHYEWVEHALKIEVTEIDSVEADPEGNLLDESPVLSPLAWPLSYNYPVQLICKDFIPTETPEEPTHLLVYRRRDDRVRFMKINAVSRLLLDQLLASPGSSEHPSGRSMLRTVAKAIGRQDPNDLNAVGEQLMASWMEKDIILGTRKNRTGND